MIRVSDVTYSYDDASSPALSHVTLEIPDGEMIAVVGHNGSGKSTLAKCLNGLLLPTEGTVSVNGMLTSDESSLLSIRQHVGIVFQNPDNQLVTTIVEEDVAFGPENLGIAPDEIRRRVDSSLEEVGMGSYALSASSTLSGGQKQRIAIAGMLAMQPDVLVLDEATAMLDPQGHREIIEIAERLHREKGITIVMITQHMEETIGCDRIVVMGGGQIWMDGTPREIFRRVNELQSLGLDVPETVWLRNRLLSAGVSLDGDPLTLEETAEAICRSFLKK
ncbi:MAG: energy-coupling factor transporter ATPase [Clostridia bacterium]|nr:energy-coupling factor transporter ATPase [Clostridia bacterium]MBQ5758154.1 energy-coupling factor transporter ATPase [Clostridia bacterium]